MRARAPSLTERFDALVARGELLRDASQRAAVEKLQALADALDERRAMSVGFARALSTIFRGAERPTRGLYLWGSVGRGKTLLMNLFYEALSADKKRRVHFHAFMADVHERLHRIRRNAGECVDDPVSCVAQEIARETRVLCFDEFAVHDIADATILARLFAVLLAADVVVVATSNVEPSKLYEGGRNRDLFLPFIALLEERLEVAPLAAEIDYRETKIDLGEVCYSPADVRAQDALDRLFNSLAGDAPGAPTFVESLGRRIDVPLAAGKIARFDFAEICGAALGASDYIALAQRFDAFIIDGVPIMTPEQRNEARRFITLIDLLYEAHALLALSADAEPAALYDAPYGAEAHDFARVVSRLTEMRSHDYLAACAARIPSPALPS